MSNANPSTILNWQTGITIGLAVVVLGASVAAAWWFGQWVGEDFAWKRATDTRLMGIERAIETGTADRWSSVDMLRWAHRLQEQNQELKVPEPYQNGRR